MALIPVIIRQTLVVDREFLVMTDEIAIEAFLKSLREGGSDAPYYDHPDWVSYPSLQHEEIVLPTPAEVRQHQENLKAEYARRRTGVGRAEP